jgi:hypothetical protein
MITLPLTFLQLQVLAVSLAAPAPLLALHITQPLALACELVQPTPTLHLVIRPPQALDAALLPVLIGPPGPASGPGAAPTSRTLTWAAGRLAAVAYADGRTKALTYTGDQLTQVDRLTPGLPTQRATLQYHPDGTLASVLEATV